MKRKESITGYAKKDWKFELLDFGMILPPTINEKRYQQSLVKRKECLVKITVEEL